MWFDDEHYPLDCLPHQLIDKDFYFCHWPNMLRAEGRLYDFVDDKTSIYSPYSLEFQRNICVSGVVVGFNGLVALVLHEREHFWRIAAELGNTFSSYNLKRNAITLFYKVSAVNLRADTKLPTMTYIKRMEQEQEQNFKLRIEKEGQEALASPQMRPVFSLITKNHSIAVDKACFCYSEEPIKEISAQKLLEGLDSLALPYPLAKAYYFEGQERIEFEGVTLEVGLYTKMHLCLL